MTDLNLYNITKLKDDVYFSKAINNSGEEFTLQFKTTCELDLNNNKAKLKIEDSSVFNEISDKVLEITHQNSNNWFNKHIEKENLKNIYKDALFDNHLHVVYNSDSSFYSKTENFKLDELPSVFKGIVLIRLMGVIYTKTSFFCF